MPRHRGKVLQPQNSLPASAFSAIAENELVARRVAELDAAALLRRPRMESIRGDWEAVDRLIADARARFAGNPWVAAVLESIEQLAHRRDLAMFAKESLYSSARMASRLAAVDESVELSERAMPSFLRRKKAQGRSEFERRKPDDKAS